jgi:hypothetical protein
MAVQGFLHARTLEIRILLPLLRRLGQRKSIDADNNKKGMKPDGKAGKALVEKTSPYRFIKHEEDHLWK